MFEPILAGIVVFVLFVFSVDVFTAPKGKPDNIPLPEWLFTEKRKQDSAEEKFGKAVKSLITDAIKDAKK
ncbi:MAG: hypothetical protein AAF215_21475 [Cyanobacteria bacterium P01_A01_bin.123]